MQSFTSRSGGDAAGQHRDPAVSAGSPPPPGCPPTGLLAHASIGAVPITWNNADLPDLTPFVPAATVMDEIARLGFAGTQAGVGFPQGAELAVALQGRGLQLAEIYAALPCTVDGPTAEALPRARATLHALGAAGGGVLVAALVPSAEREVLAGRAQRADTPVLGPSGLDALASLLQTVAVEADALDIAVAFHPHAGTFIETAAEVDALLAALDRLTGPAGPRTGICLDVGHYTVGGGDPVSALRRYGERVTHVHLKDVDPRVLEALRAGRLRGFFDALRARLFTELGSGAVDLDGVLTTLAERDYAGWLMVEQDTTWLAPGEALAVGRHVLSYAIRHVAASQMTAA